MDARCSRQSTNKDAKPTFLCEVNITVSQTKGCDTRVTETFVLPHTNGDKYIRELYIFDSSQKVSDVRASLDGATKVIGSKLQARRLTLSINTTKRPKPATIKLSYALKNGALQMKTTCNPSRLPFDVDLLRWGFVKWKQSFDILRVRFNSDSSNVTVVPGNYDLKKLGKSSTELTKWKVSGSFESYAKLVKSDKCKPVYECTNRSAKPISEGYGTPDGLLLWIIGIGTGALMFCYCLCARIKQRDISTRAAGAGYGGDEIYYGGWGFGGGGGGCGGRGGCGGGGGEGGGCGGGG